MSPEEPKYFEKFKLEKIVLKDFKKSKKIPDSSFNSHVMINDCICNIYHHISTALLLQ
jgi:hypothetical protein